MHTVLLSKYLLLSHFRSSLNYRRKASATEILQSLADKGTQPTQVTQPQGKTVMWFLTGFPWQPARYSSSCAFSVCGKNHFELRREVYIVLFYKPCAWLKTGGLSS
jgi:hypothetical protein